MNYYERHLGDYAKDTGHLSLLEHGVYTLLLDRYYSTETGIPADQAHRICRARSKDEREAVDTVLSEFFALVDGVWTNARADAEIDKFLESEPEREAKRDNAKERQRRFRERRSSMFETLREHDIVPPYDASMPELETLLKRVTSQPATRDVTPPITRDKTTTHTPDTNTHTPVDQKKRAGASAAGSRLPADWALPDDWREWAEAERPGLSIQAEADKFADYWRSAAGAKGRKADWQATWRNWIRNAHDQRPAHATKPSTAANFRGKTYTGTPIDDIPESLRPAA